MLRDVLIVQVINDMTLAGVVIAGLPIQIQISILGIRVLVHAGDSAVHGLGGHHLADVEVVIGVLVNGVDHIIVLRKLSGSESTIVQLGVLQLRNSADGGILTVIAIVNAGNLTQVVVDLYHADGLGAVIHIDLSLSAFAGELIGSVVILGDKIAIGIIVNAADGSVAVVIALEDFLAVHIHGPGVVVVLVAVTVADHRAQVIIDVLLGGGVGVSVGGLVGDGDDLILGKDEVPSSNLGSSSKIPLELLGSGGIFLVFITFKARLFLRFLADPHRDPHAEMKQRNQWIQECRTGRRASCPAHFFCFYRTCSRKLPMVAAASSCFCRVAWV